MLRAILVRAALRLLVWTLAGESVTALEARSQLGSASTRCRLAVLPNSLPFSPAWDEAAGLTPAEALKTIV